MTAFMFLEIIFFEIKYYLVLRSFVYLLPSFVNEMAHNTLPVFDEGAIEHILRAKVWLYGFESVFRQVLIDFLFVYLFFFNSIKNWIRTVLNSVQ